MIDGRSASRPFNFLLWLGLPLSLMALLLIVDPAPLDFALARLAYIPGSGFVGRDSGFLEDVLHDRAKQLIIAFGLLAICGFGISLLPTRWRVWRRPLGYLVLALGLSTSLVTPLKIITQVQCPWSLSEFGGTERFAPLLGAHPPTLKPGRCWPGGHASSGFSLFALYFLLRDRRPRLARAGLLLALGLGTLFSVARMLQGAHFLSHNIWTMLFDWLICAATYRLVLYRPAVRSARTAPCGITAAG